MNSGIVGIVLYSILLCTAALLFCWLFVSVVAAVCRSFVSMFRTLTENYRDRAAERRRAREAEKWGLP